MPLNRLMKLCYIYIVIESSVKGIKRSLYFSYKTLCTWLKFVRQLVDESVFDLEMVTNGEDIIVEIYEIKFGKRKYHQ